MNKLSIFNIAAVVLPFLSIFIGGGVALYELNRLHQLQADYTHAQEQIALIDRTLAEQREGPQGPRRATVAPSRHEQTDFLTWLHTYEALTHVKISKWATAPSTPSPGVASALPPGVTAIDIVVEVKGAYNDIRRFLYNVERDSPRLLNLSNTNWARVDGSQTHLTFTLTRYIAPETTASAPPGTE